MSRHGAEFVPPPITGRLVSPNGSMLGVALDSQYLDLPELAAAIGRSVALLQLLADVYLNLAGHVSAMKALLQNV